MPFYPANDGQKELLRVWCDALLAGQPGLPRQVMDGRDLSNLIDLQAGRELPEVGLYATDNGQVLGAMLISRPAGSHDAAVAWVSAAETTHAELNRMLREGLEQAFAAPELHRLTWDLVDADGRTAARHCKYGFVAEGHFRESFLDGQSYRDVTRFGLLRKDWLAAKAAWELRCGMHAQAAGAVETYSIQVLTDATSWITSYIDELADEWAADGHTVRVSHKVEQCRPADFCFCLSFSCIVPSSIRSQYLHTLVVHESDLPQGRGWAPMTWQILEGKSRIPVTLIEAVDTVDAGPIYLQEWINLAGTELHPEWRALQAQATQNLCRQWVRVYPGILEKARQQEGECSVYARRRPVDSRLDSKKTLAEQFDLLRVVDNKKYPAFFEMKGRRYRFCIEPWSD